MKVLLNFSHPLTEEGMEKAKTLLGLDELEQVVVPVQLDFDRPLEPQLERLVEECHRHTPVAIVPPSFAPAAAYLSAETAVGCSDAMRPMRYPIVVVARVGQGIGGKFLPIAIV